MRNAPRRGVSRQAHKALPNPERRLDTEHEEPTVFAGPQSAPLLQSVLDSLTYPFYVIDVADYHLCLANRAAREAYHGGAATCYALTHRRDVPCHSTEHPCPIEIIKETGKPTVVEHIHYDEDGTPRNVEVHAFPIFDPTDALVQIIEYTVDITERKQAEETLRAEKALSESMIESLPGTFYLFDAQGRLLKWNKNLERVSGYTTQEIARMHPLDFFEGQDKRLIEQRIQEVFTKGQSFAEAQLVSKDGRKTPYFFTGLATTIGNVPCLIGMGIDISKRKHAEEALHQSERRFRGTFENAPIGIAHVALDGRILRFNSRFCQIVGCPRSGALNATCEGTPLADDWEAERVQIQRLLDGEVTHYSIEKHYLHRDGGPVWVNLTRSIQRDEAGQVEHFIVVIEDISERKRAEEALRQAEQKFRAIFDNTSDGIFLHDLESLRLTMGNKSCLQMLGYTEEEFTKLSVADLHPEADLPFIYAQIHTFLSGGKPIRRDIRFQRKDGSILFADVSPDLVELDGGRYALVVLKDITERRRAEDALRELNATLESQVSQRTAELRHRARQLQKLTLDMSVAEERERERMAEILHDDLQQLLAAAKFHVGLMRNRTRSDVSLQATAAQVDHMLKEAIDKSRSLSHELSPAVMHHADFAETLRWLASEVKAKHGLVVHVHAHGPVRSQSEALKAFLFRAVQELLFNVVKHARVHEARVRVRRLGRCLCLSVSDRGRGFDPQALGETAGYGLLSIRERIELLGGRMTIKSAKGQGSTLRIVVPDSEKPEDTVGVGPRAYPMPATPGGHGGPPLRVLLADDHEIVREGLLSLLSEEHTVEVVGEAANGREAIDLAYRLEPDVVIMDVSMPLIEGAEATRQIKAHLPQMRVIALSMYDEPEKMESMYRAGAESYVLKTAPFRELLAAVRGKESDLKKNPVSSESDDDR